MASEEQTADPILNFNSRTASLALVLAVLVTTGILGVPAAPAQTYTILHNFSGGDGANPYAGLTMDRAGNLYGTTEYGGTHICFQTENLGCGTVFKLTHGGSGWVFSELYDFTGGTDEGYPQARVVFGPDGTLYGTTGNGGLGGAGGPGTVFNLRPPARPCKSVSCPWTETVLFAFSVDAGWIPLGDLAFDAAGDIYGTTEVGGKYQNGVVYELTGSGGVWTENVLWNFTGGVDGGQPTSGVIFDRAGNLYGTVPTNNYQGNTLGLVYELVPSGTGWTEKALYYFQGSDDGAYPYAGLLFDAAGNLYGAARNEGANNGGTAFRLTPVEGNWSLATLYGFAEGRGYWGPVQALAMDSAGNLYGATSTDGAYGHGAVFKLTPSNGGWVYTSLHDFGGDGYFPNGNLAVDASGNIYGTTYSGGNYGCGGDGCGVVFEITP